MSRRTITRLVDDIDGKDIDQGGQTITFSFSGVDYSIDLSDRNAEKFQKAIGPYIEAATRIGGRRTPSLSTTTGQVDTKAVRAWAASSGIELSARGRVPASVVEQYRAAGN